LRNYYFLSEFPFIKINKRAVGDIANYDNIDFYNRNPKNNGDRRKIVKIFIFSTPDQYFIEKLKNNTILLPTFNLRNGIFTIINTIDKMELSRSLNILSILNRFRDGIIFNSEK
jgi:CRISPR/Cas system endoribonuclease Cas6 (RAMP superfamily)